MKLFYTIGVNLYVFAVRIAALWNDKARKWLNGRKGIWQEVESFQSGIKVYWFHCASLGEFEQGRPIIEALKEKEGCQIVISFFSPSGYEIRKNYELADLIFYLPKDSKKNANRLLNSIKPDAIFFIKYEFWANYILEAVDRKIPVYSISAVFRKDQVFFKWYGGWMRNVLKSFSGIFVQDEASGKLLEEINIKSMVAGDTRYDRVMQNAQKVITYPEIENCVTNRKVFICGSVWKPDVDVIMSGLNHLGEDWMVIIAPHQIGEAEVRYIEERCDGKVLRYSNLNDSNTKNPDFLIIDNIGMLMNLYQYSELAYIGGAFKTGLHNILEPAAFGVPVIFGPEYAKFHEAQLFIDAGIGFAIKDAESFNSIVKNLIERNISEKVLKFMNERKGATDIIVHSIFP